MKRPQEEVAEFWGDFATGMMLLEEMGELSQAVVKYFRILFKGKLVPTGRTKKEAIENIAEEIADVRICLDEFEYLLGVEAKSKEWGDKKREREQSRMKSEKRKRGNILKRK